MSHEIRTPMNGVLGMIDVLQRQGLDGSQRRTVSTIRDSAQSLLRIIDDVLDFSKIEAGRLELEETAFSLSGLIDGVAGTFREQATAKGLALNVEIDAGSDDALVGDPTRVRQVLFNLLGNAHQVHRTRPCHAARRYRAAGSRQHQSHDRGDRYRHRSHRRAARAPVPALRAGRFVHHAPFRRHRAWPLDRASSGATDEGRHRGR